MKALSIRQPWAWLILRPDITDPAERERARADGRMKGIENRDWPTIIRGRILIHAAKGMTRGDYELANDPVSYRGGPTIILPPFEQLERGGIVGYADLVDCITVSDSPWFNGDFGFVLHNQTPVPFIPYRGMLGFFYVPDDVIDAGARPAAQRNML